ncbi:MAG: hypothetical protein V1720_22405 [bacterium]
MRKLFLICFIAMAIFFTGCEKSGYDYYKDGLEKFDKTEFNAAYEDFSLSIKSDSTNIDAYYQRSLCGNYTGKPDQINDLTKYIEEVTPKLANAFTGRGMLRRIKNEYDLAIDDFEKAIMLVPSRPQPYGLKIETMKAKGDSIAADEFYNSLSQRIKNEIDKL